MRGRLLPAAALSAAAGGIRRRDRDLVAVGQRIGRVQHELVPVATPSSTSTVSP